MQKIFRKKLWKDIFIMIILLGITFLRYTTFKEIKLFNDIYCAITAITFAYGTIYALYNLKNNKERKWFVCISCISLLFLFYTDMMDVYIYFLIAAIFKDNKDKFLKWYFVASTVIFAICMSMYFFEIIPSRDVYRGTELRSSLGFVHPNTVFRYFLGAITSLYLMDKKKIAFTVYTISATIPLYLLTDSRTGLICSLLFVVLANVGRIFEKGLKKVNLKYGYLFATVFSIGFIVLFHDNPGINEVLSGRPQMLYDLLMEPGMHILRGYKKFAYCDNRFIYLIIRNGALALIITNVFYYFVFKKETSLELKIIFVITLIYGLTENLRSFGQTIVPLMCMWSLYENYVKNKIAINDKNIQKLTNNENK